MNRRTPPDAWLDKSKPTREVLAELGLERRTAYMRYGPRGTLGMNGRKSAGLSPRRKFKQRPCPCCGTQGVFATHELDGPIVTFGPVSQNIFKLVRDAPDGIAVDQIADHIYGSRTKGADNQHTTIMVLISKMNEKLRKVGLKIRKAQSGTWGTPYFLVEL